MWLGRVRARVLEMLVVVVWLRVYGPVDPVPTRRIIETPNIIPTKFDYRFVDGSTCTNRVFVLSFAALQPPYGGVF